MRAWHLTGLREPTCRSAVATMAVCTAADPTLLASLLDEQAASPGTERQMSAHNLV